MFHVSVYYLVYNHASRKDENISKQLRLFNYCIQLFKKNFLGPKHKARRQDRKVMWDFFLNKFIKTSYASYSEDLRWRAIWIKEILGYQVDEVAAA